MEVQTMAIIHIQLYITSVQLAYMSASLIVNSVQIKDLAIPTKGNNIQLVCSISGFSSSTVVSWYKTDTQTIPDGTGAQVQCLANTCLSGSPGYTYTADDSNIYVTITDLSQTTDGKWWTCQFGTQTKALQLVVYTVPQYLNYSSVPSETRDLSDNSVTMKCKASCAHPAPTFVWYYLETRGSRQQYSASGVAGEETGNTCTDTEKLYTSTLTLPRFTTFTGNADKAVKLECGIPTFPGRDTALYTQLSPDITFAVQTTSVNLRDGSSQPTSSSVITVTNGLPKTLTCSPSLSRPAATIVWYIDNVEKQRSSTSFTFTPSDNDHDKHVHCKAFNIPPESQAVFSERPLLYVQVAPDVTADLSTPNLEENSSVNVTCNAVGRPATYNYTNLVQTWQGTVIPNTHFHRAGTERYRSLALTSLQLQDTGNYTCHVNNGIRDRTGELDQTGNVYLKVKVSPKIFPVRVIFAGAPDDTVKMSIPFYSYPATNRVTFAKQGGSPIQTGGKYTVSYLQAPVLTQFYGQDVTLGGSLAVLEIKHLQEKDFVNYTLTISNNIGTEVQIFSLNLNSVPFPPKTFVYLGLFDKVPRFYWEQGFNGGHVQLFVIETTLIGTDKWIKHEVVAEGDQLYQQKNKSYIANITRLVPGKYSARLTVKNKLGPIEVSDRPTATFTIPVSNAPQDMRIEHIGETTAVLSWKHVYFGHLNDTHVIQISKDLKSWTDYVSVYSAKEENITNAKLEHLNETTLYFVRMFTYNVFGRSPASEIVFFTTLQRKERIQPESLSEAAIGGIVAGCLALVCCGILVFLARNYKVYCKKKQGSPDPIASVRDTTSGRNRNSIPDPTTLYNTLDLRDMSSQYSALTDRNITDDGLDTRESSGTVPKAKVYENLNI